jgi:hypothetical protein
VSNQMTDPKSVGEMPAGDMANLTGQPGTVANEMPLGAMTGETAMASTAMPEGRPGVEGEMPVQVTVAAVGAQDEMPAGVMSDGQPGVDGDMPAGAMGVAPKVSDKAASSPAAEQPVLEVTGKWQLTFWVSQVTRN